MNTKTHEMALVLGGTGKTGRRLLLRLGARGLATRAGSRSGEPSFDWDDRATWEPALRGITSAYISFYPDLALPGAAETVGAFARLAAESGVRRVVLLSGRGEPEAQRTEQAVQAAGAAWTIVRCSWFNQNFSESFLLDPVRAGTVALPVGAVAEPFVDVEDVAVAALTEPGHDGRIYELTGPRALRFEQAVAQIAGASRRPIRFVPVSVADYVAELTAHGVPSDVIGLMTYLFTEVLDGRNVQLADGVQRALGREPADFADYARRTAAAGVWAG